MTGGRGMAAGIAAVVLAVAAGCGPVDTEPGDGTGPADAVPRLDAPKAVDLGTVFVDDAQTTSLTLANRGDADLVVTALRLEYLDVELFVPAGIAVGLPDLPLTLAPGEAHVLEVRFHPRRLGLERAILHVDSNHPGVPTHGVHLSGTGGERPVEPPPPPPPPVCELQAWPQRLSFWRLPADENPRGEVMLVNRSLGAECSLGPPTLSGHPAFILEGDPEPLVLGPGEAHTWTVVFAPPAGQAVEATGQVVWEVADSDPLVVELAGVSIVREPQLIPDDYTFGETQVSCRSFVREFCLYNTDLPIALLDAWVEVDGRRCGPDEACAFALELPDAVGSPGGLHMAPGTKACVVAQFRPEAPGDHEGVLVLDLEGRTPLQARMTGTAYQPERKVDTFLRPSRHRLDLLFVVDDSPAMAPHQENVAANLGALVQHLLDVDAWNYHLGVVTTDLSTAGGRVPGRLEPQDVAGTELRVVTRDAIDPVGTLLTNAAVGSSGSAAPAGLEAARLALSEPLATDPLGNAGFRRPDDTLLLVFLSADEDHSPDPVQTYVDFYEGLAPEWLLGIVVVDAADASCGTPNLRYREAADYVLDLCSPDWWRGIALGGGRPLATSLGLRQPPQPDSVVVAVIEEGVRTELTSGWTHDPVGNRLEFEPGVLPAWDAVIEVSYVPACLY